MAVERVAAAQPGHPLRRTVRLSVPHGRGGLIARSGFDPVPSDGFPESGFRFFVDPAPGESVPLRRFYSRAVPFGRGVEAAGAGPFNRSEGVIRWLRVVCDRS